MASGKQDLPGFYYDPELQRYFRLPPRHFSHLPQYGHLPGGTSASSLRSRATSSQAKPQHSKSKSLYEFVTTRQRDPRLQSWSKSKSAVYESLMCSVERKRILDTIETSNVTAFVDMATSDRGDLLALLSINTLVFGSFETNGAPYMELNVIHLSARARNCQFAAVRSRHSYNPWISYYPTSKLEFSCDEDGDDHLLFVHPTQLLFKKFPRSLHIHGERDGGSIQLDSHMEICTASWNPVAMHKYSCAVGHSKGSVGLLDRCGKEQCRFYDSPRSSVFSLAFSRQSPLLFAGCRSGRITAWDLRTTSRGKARPTLSVNEAKLDRVCSSVIGLHPLNDDRCLISNAFNSQLSIWDLRMQKTLWRFGGHSNTIKNCRSLVDKHETVLIAAGGDKNIRLWSLGTGDLLRTITPAEYASSEEEPDDVPVICCTDSFGGHPALLVALHDTVSVFKV